MADIDFSLAFAGANAEWIGADETHLQRDTKHVRFWAFNTQGLTPDNFEKARQWLVAHHASYADGTLTAKAPRSGRLQTLSGIYRQVHVGLHKGRDGVVSGIAETLALGWITADNWTNNLAEAFTVQGAYVGKNSAEQSKVALQWRNIDPGAVTIVEAAIQNWTLPLTDPVVQGETLTGTWIIGDITREQQADGAHSITVPLFDVVTVENITDFLTLTPTKELTENIGDPWGRSGGYVAHVGRVKRHGIILRYYDISGDSLSKVEGFTNANWQSLLTETTYEFLSKRVAQDPKTGVLTVELAFGLAPTWANTWSNANLISSSCPTALADTGVAYDDLVQIHEVTGIPIASVAAAVLATNADTGFVLQDVQGVETGEGSGKIVRRQVKVYEANIPPLIFHGILSDDQRKGVIGRLWLRRSKAALATLTGTDGAAISPFTIGAITYAHQMFKVTTHGDTSYTIIQTGVIEIFNALPSGVDAGEYAIKYLPVNENYRRNAAGDLYHDEVTYMMRVKCFPCGNTAPADVGAKAAYDFAGTASYSGGFTGPCVSSPIGHARVVQKSRGIFEAIAILRKVTLTPDTGF